MHKIYGCEKIFVNSFHHQAVDKTGDRFTVTATSPDGVIEAMESSEHKPILGVQWHPEWLEEEVTFSYTGLEILSSFHDPESYG